MFLINFLTIFFINTRLRGRIRKIAFVSSYWILALLLPMLFDADKFTIFVYAAASGFIFGIINPNIINAASMENDSYKLERLLSLYSTGLSISLIIGPLIETYYLKFYSYNVMYLIFIPLGLIGAVSSIFLKINIPEEIRGNDRIQNRKGLVASIITNTTYNIPFAAMVSFLPIYVIDRFNVSSQLAYFTFIPFYTVSFLTRLSMTIRPFKNLLFPLLTSFLLTAIGIAGLFTSENFLIMLLFIIILGIPHGAIFPMSTILISRTTTKGERNKANSYFLAINNGFFVIVPIVIGVESLYIGLKYAFLSLLVPIMILPIIFIKLYGKESFLTY
jgi:predicted MFS family arabinose efflux permease